VNLQQLRRAGRQPELPFNIELGSDSFEVTQWLRTLPGKRYVAKAQWQDKTVLIKLYVGKRAASKAAEEITGLACLHKNNLPVPSLLHSGKNDSGAWVVCEWLDAAETLSQRADVSVEGLSSQLVCPESVEQVASLIAQMHKQGVIQADIHPANFLFSNEAWWIVDAADIQEVSVEDASLLADNLGVFLAQVPESWQGKILDAYGVSVEPDLARLAVVKSYAWRSWRAKDLADKSLRDCSLFQTNQSLGQFKSFWRDYSSDISGLNVNKLDSKLSQGKLLKDGGSATVGLIEYAERELVLKRYNLKSLTHWLKRFWRPTRAWHSWIAGHRLRVLGVPTPKPVAMLEERFGPFRGRGFLLAERAIGNDLVQACESEDVTHAVAEQIASVLEIFTREKITHGDFKATNLLWGDSLSVIDLDAVTWHRSEIQWVSAFEKDIKRLLRNWSEDSMQHKVISEKIRLKLGYCPV
jgi:tRNA A-37 threonylcarbamoyl transferase component Bud32